MKKEFKFLTTVVSILLVSMLILAGCMHALSQNDSEPKDYDMDIVSETVAESKPEDITKEPPVAQNDMQKKFSDMSEISEDGRSITVITEEYLKDYWRSNYEKEVIHSLPTEEIYFIIQDSIRIYEQYDEVVLTGFASLSSNLRVAERFPFVKDKIIKTKPDVTTSFEWDDIDAIYEIILYRLKALSSPKAFFTGEEAMRSVGEEPMINSTMLPWTTFYIPNYSESTNRDYILNVVGYGSAMNSTVIEDEFSELFSFCNKNGAYIYFKSKSYEQSTKIFPTAEMESSLPCRVVAIEDRSAGKVLAWAEQTFYSDEKFEYKFPALMSWYIYAILDDGTEMHLTEALQNGYIAPKDFPNFDFPYYRSYKRKDVQQTAPYFRDIAVYTDKLAPKEYPCAMLITDSVEFMQYHTTVQNNDLFDTQRGTPDIPSFDEVYWSYDGPWFYKNSIIMVHIEADSEVLPEVASIIFDETEVEVIFKQESLGKKKDQLYTIFIETHKLEIANEFGEEHVKISYK